MGTLEGWIEREYRHAARCLLTCISPLGIIKHRPGFGQTISPKAGSVVASAVLASYDPDPDYFFHWYRDSAIVMDALRLVLAAGSVAAEARTRFAEFVDFSLSLAPLDGRTLVAAPEWRRHVQPDFARFLRTEADLASVHGDAVYADTRVNADGSLDISSWARPQHDGIASRALTLLRWSRQVTTAHATPGTTAEGEALARLLRADLAYVRRYACEPCYDIWEEELGQHYYTLRVGAEALEQGAAWLAARALEQEAQASRAAAAHLRALLDDYWLPEAGHYRSRILPGGRRSPKELDIAVILAVVHSAEGAADAQPLAHGVRDARVLATLDRLCALFRTEYAINRDLPAEREAALGRYPGDVYYSGGPYYFSTLAAAELCYRAACGAAAACELVRRGDAFLETVRAFTPQSGDLSEQFDRRTGEQTSAKHLAWSYAAFISCISARQQARRQNC